jgi:hypothetical protein
MSTNDERRQNLNALRATVTRSQYLDPITPHRKQLRSTSFGLLGDFHELRKAELEYHAAQLPMVRQ